MRTFVRALALGAALLLSTAAFAEDTRDQEALEERKADLRHRHLWIAYGLIWFSVYGFVFRTWARTRETAAELDLLKERLAELEGDDAPRSDA